MHRGPETAEPGNGISIYAFLYYVENYGPRRAIPRTRPALTRNVRDNLPRLDYCAATLSVLPPPPPPFLPYNIVIVIVALRTERATPFFDATKM